MDFLGPNTGFYLRVVAMGAVAGFTIYLGLPLAFFRGSPKTRTFLNALSVGILMFLFVEISYLMVENIEIEFKLFAAGIQGGREALWQVVIFLLGFTAGLMGLLWFEMGFLRPATEPGPANAPDPRRLALLIAFGIGLHNFSEGLIIGQAFLTGALAFGYTLVIGFALHNATEGFGIAAPVAGTRPTGRFLLLAGFIAGGPTFVGTLLGVSYTSARVESLFLALSSGAILYIVGELIHLGRRQGGHYATLTGLLVGFFLAFGADLWVETAMSRTLAEPHVSRPIPMEVGEYFFRPNRLDLTAGEAVAIRMTNTGQVDHEIEILGVGGRTERRIPAGGKTTIYLRPHLPGEGLFICDMPGHLGGGMWGRIRILPRTPQAGDRG